MKTLNEMLKEEIKEIEKNLIDKDYPFCKITTKIKNKDRKSIKTYDIRLIGEDKYSSIILDSSGNVTYKKNNEKLNYTVKYNILNDENFKIEKGDLFFELKDGVAYKKYKNMEVIEKDLDNVKKFRIDLENSKGKTRGMYRFDVLNNKVIRENYYSSKGNKYNRVDHKMPYNIVCDINNSLCQKEHADFYNEIIAFNNNVDNIINLISKDVNVLPGFNRRFKNYQSNIVLSNSLNTLQEGIEEEIQKIIKLNK